MGVDDQPVLLEIPPQPVPAARPAEGAAKAKLRQIDRAQTLLAHIYVDELVGPDHRARAIWELTGRLDLSGFSEGLKTRTGEVGRAAWDPRLLVSIWVYAYSEGISSAREIERLMEWEPGLQWLGGLQQVNHHTLSDFRVSHKTALDDLFTQLLALLQSCEMLNLDRVMHDGTKIRAQAGCDTFRRETTLATSGRSAETGGIDGRSSGGNGRTRPA
jgi:transposase